MTVMEKCVRESQYFVAWLLFWICSTIGAMLLGGAAGLVIGAVLGYRGVDLSIIQLICGGVGFLLAIPVSYLFFRLFVGVLIVKKAQDTFSNRSEMTVLDQNAGLKVSEE
jgi:uncharacterized membrane protein